MTKKKRIMLISAIALVIIIIMSFAIRKPKIVYSTEKVQKQNLVQTVSETGTIKSANEIELNFQNAGKINKINVSVGSRVSSTKILAELNYKDLLIRQKDALASLQIAKANLNKLTTGATSYEIATKEASVEKARIDYESTKEELKEGSAQAESNALISAESNLSKAQVAVDNINTILNNQESKDLLGAQSSLSLNTTKALFQSAENSITDAKTFINTAKSSKNRSDIKIALNKVLGSLNLTFDMLSSCYQTLQYSITSSSFTQTELDAFKSTVSSQQTTMSTSISSIQSSIDNLNNTELNNTEGTSFTGDISSAQARINSYYQAWKIAQAQLDELKAPARSQDLTLYEAQVRQAEASFESIQNQIENSIIRAPIDGVITRIDYKVGEQSSVAKPVIYMLSENKLEIEVDISESDITKVQKGDTVEITLDALSPDQKLSGTVYDIDPAETIISDVIYYKTKIAFDSPDIGTEIKPGMTANVIIKTAEKENVLTIPSRAIIEKNGDGKFVKILKDEKTQELPIKTGLYGDDGLVEIISGLSEGENIVTSETKK